MLSLLQQVTEHGEVIARVRKLLERAKLDAGAEAESARNLARTLMREHGIRLRDLHPPLERKVDGPHRPPNRNRKTASERIRVDLTPGRVRVKIGGLDIRFPL